MAPKMTQSTLAILKVFLEVPDEPLYGLEIGKAAGVKSGTLYPVLDRLEQAGWLVGEWESIDPHVEGRPRRRHYHLTGHGVVAATSAIRSAQRRLIPDTWLPQQGYAR